MHRTILAALAALIVSTCASIAGPNDLVLIFANETYAGTVPKARFAHRDGEEIRRAAREVLGVPESRIVLVKDATSGTFQDWFEPGGGVGPVLAQLPIRRDSTIYVYFSGHGLPAKRSGATDAEPFLLPVDTPPAQVARRGLAVADVRKALLAAQSARAPDGRVVLWLDACFTGSSGGGDLVTDARSVRISPAAGRIAEPRLVEIAAASFDQEALWDSKRGHGVFTDLLLDGLYGGADLDKDGHVTADELHRFLVDRVEDRVARLFPSPRRFQSPVLAGDGSIRIASLTGAVRDPALRAEMALRCTTMKASSDTSEIRAFLGDCGAACPCLADLQKRIVDLDAAAAVCVGERREFERLEKLGKRALVQLDTLAKAARCAAVASSAKSVVAKLREAGTGPAPWPFWGSSPTDDKKAPGWIWGDDNSKVDSVPPPSDDDALPGAAAAPSPALSTKPSGPPAPGVAPPSSPRPTATRTTIKDAGAKAKLLGKRRLTLQWLEGVGSVTVSEAGGLMRLKGTHSNPATGDHVTLDGIVTEIDKLHFIFDGTIVVRVSFTNNGEPCTRSGPMRFAITENRKYWRLRDPHMQSPCGIQTDYVDIYF